MPRKRFPKRQRRVPPSTTLGPYQRKKRRGKFNNRPTMYNGVRFRSKLETYVAKRFDALRVVWKYEPRVKLEGRRYCLPDFYLPTFGVFVEVRPKSLVDDKLREKMELITEMYAKKVYLIHHQREVNAFILQLRDRARKESLHP